MKSKLLMALGILSLTACANSNDQTFNGKRYELAETELSAGRALLQYLPYDRSLTPHILFVERLHLGNMENAEQAVSAWYKKETQYRENDCKLVFKFFQNINYATCDFKSGYKYVVYVVNPKNEKLFAKVYINSKPLTENEQQNIAKELFKFYPWD